jgi:hypothetical protein
MDPLLNGAGTGPWFPCIGGQMGPLASLLVSSMGPLITTSGGAFQQLGVRLLKSGPPTETLSPTDLDTGIKALKGVDLFCLRCQTHHPTGQLEETRVSTQNTQEGSSCNEEDQKWSTSFVNHLCCLFGPSKAG